MNTYRPTVSTSNDIRFALGALAAVGLVLLFVLSLQSFAPI